MPELMKRPTTEGSSDIVLRGVPSDKADALLEAIRAALRTAGLDVRQVADPEEAAYSIEDVFGPVHPGSAIRGLRKRLGMRQKDLADRLGIPASNLSRMEHGKRPIGKEMARRLAAALDASYKTFL